jgi:hypothetical protein
LVEARIDRERYLVSMLGDECNWVRNVRAAGGVVKLRHGSVESVQLVEVPVEQRAGVIKKYVERAPGARPHIPVDRSADVSVFETIAARYPVFRITTRHQQIYVLRNVEPASATALLSSDRGSPASAGYPRGHKRRCRPAHDAGLANRQPGVRRRVGRLTPTDPCRGSLYRLIRRPALAEIVGDGRPCTVVMISLLSMPWR